MQSFRQFLEAKKTGGRPKGHTISPGVPYITNPYRWGQAIKSAPDPEEKEHQLLKRMLPEKLYWSFRKFLARKAKEQQQFDGNEKRLMTRAMRWAKEADPTGGKHIQWILSQILKGNLGISRRDSQKIWRVIKKFLVLTPVLKNHQDHRFRDLHQKMHGMTFDEVEQMLDWVLGI